MRCELGNIPDCLSSKFGDVRLISNVWCQINSLQNLTSVSLWGIQGKPNDIILIIKLRAICLWIVEVSLQVIIVVVWYCSCLVIFFTSTLNSKIWLIWTWWIYLYLILLNNCLMLFLLTWKWWWSKELIIYIYQCIISCAFAFIYIWSRSRSYGCDNTGTHHASPEEECDVKKFMAFLLFCIHGSYQNIMLLLFWRLEYLNIFVDAKPTCDLNNF